MPVIVTGAAGFIGAAVSLALLERGESVVGIDNLNSYYDVSLKQHRLEALTNYPSFRFHPIDISDQLSLLEVCREYSGAKIVHLAAQAGVRHSLTAPNDYVKSNFAGFTNVAELAREIKSEHLVYASTSSVYGLNRKSPYVESDSVRHPLNLYSASKIANEAIAHAYSYLFGIPTTGLRFFTVYGPAGRPDMSPLIFARHILQGTKVPLFGNGKSTRDYTYIDDIVRGVIGVLDTPARPSATFDALAPVAHESAAPYAIYNIGAGSPITVMDFLGTLASALGKQPVFEMWNEQDGDMQSTHADTSAIRNAMNWSPQVSLKDGVAKLAHWCIFNPHLLG